MDFTLAELKKLRGYFEQLDDDGSGSIGLEELEQPLISLNLCKSRAEVQQVMNKIDLDGNGTLEFDEFLALVKTAKTMKAENKQGKRESSLPPLKKSTSRFDEGTRKNRNRSNGSLSSRFAKTQN